MTKFEETLLRELILSARTSHDMCLNVTRGIGAEHTYDMSDDILDKIVKVVNDYIKENTILDKMELDKIVSDKIIPDLLNYDADSTVNKINEYVSLYTNTFKNNGN